MNHDLSILLTYRIFYTFRFYMKCLLPEIIDPQFPKRMLKSDIREPDHIKKKMIIKKNE